MYLKQLLNIDQGTKECYDASPIEFVLCEDDSDDSYYGLIRDSSSKKEDEKQKRLKTIKRHIKYDDYFGTLATVVDLIRQSNEKSIGEIEKYNEALQRLKNDFVYLQDNYKIIKKKKK